MKIKRYLGVFLIALTLLGIKNNTISQPNQEIIVQFNAGDVTVSQSQEAIAVITQQLHTIGVNNIQIHRESNGNYKIAYHSNVASEQIKYKLLSNQDLAFNTTSFETTSQHGELPSKEHRKKIDVLVYDIKDYDKHFGAMGVTVVNQKNDLNTNNYFTIGDVYGLSADAVFLKPLCLTNKTTEFVLNTILHTIPEVRAGPKNV